MASGVRASDSDLGQVQKSGGIMSLFVE